jgi:hypothetical protein
MKVGNSGSQAQRRHVVIRARKIGLNPYIGCLKSNDTLTIYLAQAISFFPFVLRTFLYFYNVPGSIVS